MTYQSGPNSQGFDLLSALAKITANPADSGFGQGQGWSSGGGDGGMGDYTPYIPTSHTGGAYLSSDGYVVDPGNGGGPYTGGGNYMVYKPADKAKGETIENLNGRGFDIYSSDGKYLGSDIFRNLKDSTPGQQLAGMLSVAIGGPLLGGALAGAAAAGGAGAGAAAGAGGAEAGALGYGGTSTGFLSGTAGGGYGSMLGAMPAVEGAAAGLPALATYGGLPLAEMGAWSAGAGALGSAVSSIPGEAPPSNPYATPEGMPPPANPMLNSGSGNPLSSMTDGFDWTKLIGPAAGLVNGAMGASAADKAADTQLQATREAAALSEPWRQAGSKALNRMQEILGIGGDSSAADYGINAKPFTFTQDDPSYTWRFDQGQKAVESSAANRGGLFSGRAAKELQRYGQDAASQEYSAAFNRDQVTKTARINPLQSLAGQGQTAATTIGNYTTDGGNAQAAGTVGSSNAWTNAISGALNNYQQNELMNRLLRS